MWASSKEKSGFRAFKSPGCSAPSFGTWVVSNWRIKGTIGHSCSWPRVLTLGRVHDQWTQTDPTPTGPTAPTGPTGPTGPHGPTSVVPATYKATGMNAAPPRPKRLNSTGFSMIHQPSTPMVPTATWMANIQLVACADAIHSSKPGRNRVRREG
jgi:hypothetical protein